MKKLNIISIAMVMFAFNVCVPPETSSDQNSAAMKAELLKKQEERCPQLMSSATEQYNNKNWQVAVNRYKQANKYNCSEWQPAYFDNLYQYFAIAYEQMGKFDSSEAVCLDGLNIRPKDKALRIRLAYSYSRQKKIDQEIIEYERLVDMDPEDMAFMTKLAKLYKDNERYDDQIDILEKILSNDENNVEASSELGIAYKNSGRDPLDIYRKRYDDNPENLSFGFQLAEALIEVSEYEESIPVLEKIISIDPSNKQFFKRLAEAKSATDDLDGAAKAYVALFKIDPRDSRIAIEISKLYIDDSNFRQALKWAEKAIDLDKKSGEAYAQKGDVYFNGWDNFREMSAIRVDDKIVARLAYNYWSIAENKGYTGPSKIAWLKENESDLLFGKSDWFMVDKDVRRRGSISTSLSEYDWITESLKEKEEG